jgi:hypothetical protein
MVLAAAEDEDRLRHLVEVGPGDQPQLAQ